MYGLMIEPPRTLQQVIDSLAEDKKKPGNCDISMARLMVKFGNLTDEAREYARQYLERG